jgi:carboxypeptidase C (cathepsin A)
LVLVSPALDTAILHPEVTNLMPAAFVLPSLAATAAALAGKPPAAADFAAAERFALSDYLTGLAQLPTQPTAPNPFLARVAALIGMPEDTVQRERGRISSDTFTHELRKPQHEILSLYDGTVTRPTTGNPWDDHAGDAILDGATAAYTAAFDIYAPQALGYRTDLQYRTLHRDTSRQWDWDAANHGGGGLGLALSSLQSAMLAHPQTRVLIANGRYDLVTPYFASRWLVDQLSLPDAVRKSIATRVYEGGHMMYMRPGSRAALAADAAALFAGRDAAAPE